jgi:hypothetical protein
VAWTGEEIFIRPLKKDGRIKRGKIGSQEAGKLGKTVPFGQINACGGKREAEKREAGKIRSWEVRKPGSYEDGKLRR